MDVRVCGSPGRDKDKREGKPPSSPANKKEGTSRKRSNRDSTDMGEQHSRRTMSTSQFYNNHCSVGTSDGGPPIAKQKKVTTEQSGGGVGERV